MRIKVGAVILILFTVASCIKKEALNAEADIESATLDNQAELLQEEPVIGSNSVVFRLKNFPGSFQFAPEFSVTSGATMSPESGTELNFSTPQEYIVTSEDGQWSKTYEVSFVVDRETIQSYSFENVDTVKIESPTKKSYVEFYDYNSDHQKIKNWSSGNPGYSIVVSGLVGDRDAQPEDFPTFQTANGFAGKAVKLVTRSTGSLGSLVGSNIAAGNLYIGTFNLSFPAIRSTHFGIPYTTKKAPLLLRGYFKYQPGNHFETCDGCTSNLTEDTWDASAILFENRELNGENTLPGDHHFKDPRMVAFARVTDEQRALANPDHWTEMKFPFEFLEGKSFDPEGNYLFTIIFTSSKEGGEFNGAVGSTLWVDEVELVAVE